MYRHTQKGNLIVKLFVTLAAASALAGYLMRMPFLFYPLAMASAALYFVFKDLTVEVDKSVRLEFGIGWIKREFSLSEITSTQMVRNPWWFGWGVHYIRRLGWVYGIDGSYAVELELAGGKKARIGTDQPEALKTEIDARLAAAGTAPRTAG